MTGRARPVRCARMCAACAEASRSRPRRADASTRLACLSRAFGDSLERVAGRTRRARHSRAPVCSRRSTAYVVAAISRAVFAGVAHARGARFLRRSTCGMHVARGMCGMLRRIVRSRISKGGVRYRRGSPRARARPHGHTSGTAIARICAAGTRADRVWTPTAASVPHCAEARRGARVQGRRRWPFRRAGIDTFEIGTSGIPVDAPPIVPTGGRVRRSGSTLSTCEGDAVAHSRSNAHFMIQCVRRGGGDSLRFFAPPPAPARA
ncbi:hypothetical protein BMAA0669 [Burkholderia mallei ATCC 23344]|uniref:Uncharacterized protein n=1 Tax=Burkholderia mallei (strain ATCC 23344) TaxID=243160 RepID=A0A0H2WDC2_BURMA|nr:hypothetical protein BMAA0669 [Burkholderia mallei ATCC 23344]RKN97990.1 hypothetical protein D8O03_19265 [Burkholderia mallei]RPA21310.1 hypothetical protein EGT61_007305 [Burkholderia mallei]RPA48361.1 hypothetical protein EGT66_19355 [Burkholderia mallei]